MMVKTKSCCGPKKEYKGNNPLTGLAYGLFPHIGCIAFIIASILGVTILMQFFRPFLMNRYIFHYLILLSVVFATISSLFYLRKNKCLCWSGIKRKKGYLSIMYGSTIGINLLLFLVVFPLTANLTSGLGDQNLDDASLAILNVDIPCSGHVPLISNELKTIDGVIGSSYTFPYEFKVYYDSKKTNLDEILDLKVFVPYPATVISSTTNSEVQSQTEFSQSTNIQGGCARGCGGAGTCAGSCGSPTCSLAG